MTIKIEWTEALLRQLYGTLVKCNGEICVLVWDQMDAKAGTRVWLLSTRDGMLYLYGTVTEAVDKLNQNEVLIYHRRELVSVSGALL